MRGKLLLLHQQRLVQLTLVLLDLLLHVGDCTCNLGRREERRSNNRPLKDVFKVVENQIRQIMFKRKKKHPGGGN